MKRLKKVLSLVLSVCMILGMTMTVSAEGPEQQAAGDFLIRWTTVVSSRFDSKTFQKEHAAMYSRYLKQTESRRFSIA